MATINRILLGIGFIIFGVFILWYSYKYSIPKDKDFMASNMKGYVAGIISIMIGISLFIGYGHW